MPWPWQPNTDFSVRNSLALASLRHPTMLKNKLFVNDRKHIFSFHFWHARTKLSLLHTHTRTQKIPERATYSQSTSYLRSLLTALDTTNTLVTRSMCGVCTRHPHDGKHSKSPLNSTLYLHILFYMSFRHHRDLSGATSGYCLSFSSHPLPPVSSLPSGPSSGGECKCKHRVCTVRPLRQNRECASWHLNFAKIGTRCTESKFS